MIRIFFGAIFGATIFCNLATADPLVTDAGQLVPAVTDWSGVNVGIGFSQPLGNVAWAERSVGAVSLSDKWDRSLGHVTAGYDWQNDRLVYGVAVDLSLGRLEATPRTSASFNCPSGCETTVRNMKTLRARVGYAAADYLFFATGGVTRAEAEGHFQGFGVVGKDTLQGWTAGVGLAMAVSPRVSVSAEFLNTDLGRLEIPRDCNARCYADIEFRTVRMGLNFRY